MSYEFHPEKTFQMASLEEAREALERSFPTVKFHETTLD